MFHPTSSLLNCTSLHLFEPQSVAMPRNSIACELSVGEWALVLWRLRREKAAVVIQKNVRMHQQRKKFLYETELGRRMKEKQERERAAVVLQKFARR